MSVKFVFSRKHFGYLNYVTMISLGMIAGVMGSFIGTPTDLILIRMIADINLPAGDLSFHLDIFSRYDLNLRQ